ncbi:hypothetical protein C8R47DRAFT_1062633 [Mycena vitilis]|nr:hypothetical protein C8R47DRAFT_1062633 [Mycena vitilis]
MSTWTTHSDAGSGTLASHSQMYIASADTGVRCTPHPICGSRAHWDAAVQLCLEFKRASFVYDNRYRFAVTLQTNPDSFPHSDAGSLTTFPTRRYGISNFGLCGTELDSTSLSKKRRAEDAFEPSVTLFCEALAGEADGKKKSRGGLAFERRDFNPVSRIQDMAHRLCAGVRRALCPSESPTWCGGYEDKFEGGRDGGQNKRVFVLQEKTHYLNIIHDKAETREAVHTCQNIPPPLGKKWRGRVHSDAGSRAQTSSNIGWCAPRTKSELLSNTDAGSGGALNMTSKAAVLFYVHRNVQDLLLLLAGVRHAPRSSFSAAWEPGWEGEGRSLNLTKSRMSEVSVPWQLLNSWVKPTKKSATKRLVGRRESNPDLSQYGRILF